MASIIFSGMSAFSSLGSFPLGILYAEILLKRDEYEGYYVDSVEHYKEKSAIGHELHVLRIRKRDKPTAQIVVRIERRPSTRKVMSSRSSDFWTDDSISQLDPGFRPRDHYHISTTICSKENPLTVLALCDICAFIRNAAPIYSVTKAKHCYWFCAAFLIRLRALGYTTQPLREGDDFHRRGRFRGIALITDSSVEKELSTNAVAASRPPLRPSSFLSFSNPFSTSRRRQTPPWVADGEFSGHTDLVRAVCFTADGRHVLSGAYDNTIRMCTVGSGNEARQPLKGHMYAVRSVALSPDGRRIASGSDDFTVRIWELEAGVPTTEPLQGHTDYVQSVAFSPDGRKIVSGSDDRSLRIWDVETGAAVGEPLIGHRDSVRTVAWSPDGNLVISGSKDATIRMWDAHTGAPVGEALQGHTKCVNSLAISPDGRRVVSASDDETIRIWDVASGEALGDPL